MADNYEVKSWKAGDKLRASDLSAMSSAIGTAVNTDIPSLNEKVDNVTEKVSVIPGDLNETLGNVSTKVDELTASVLNIQDTQITSLRSDVDAVNARLGTLINDAPETLDTLKEIADELGSKANASAVSVISDLANTNKTVLEGKADKGEAYTKAEADAKFLVADDISDKANNSDVYTKVEVDNKLADKADKGEAYTKMEADAKFLVEHQDISGKADKADVDEAFEGVRSALDNKAEKSELPTKVSELENDSGFLTTHQDISGKADKADVEASLAAKADKSALPVVPTAVSAFENDAGYLTEHQDISGKADKGEAYTKSEADAKFLTEHQSLDAYALKTELPDISGKADKADVDEAVQGVDVRLTAVENTLPGLATTGYVDGKISELVDGADDALNTLKEIGTALNDKANAGAVSAIENLVATNRDNIDKNATETAEVKANLQELAETTPRYQAFTYTDSEGETRTRKTVQLANYDSISGIDTEGSGHNLVMLSRWNVADFGAPRVHMNLNTKDAVTINDDKIVATVDQIPDVSGFATTAAVNELSASMTETTGVISGNVSTLTDTVNGLGNQLATKASQSELDELTTAVNAKADVTFVNEALALKSNSEDVYTKAEADAKFLTEHQNLDAYALKAELPDISGKADKGEAYTKDEADAKFLTEHQDISGKADAASVNEALELKADKTAIAEDKDAIIAQLNSEVLALKKMIGSLNAGKNVTVTFEANTDRELRDYMAYNGTVKLMEDVDIANGNIYAATVAANNEVILNLNKHNIEFNRSTASFDYGIYARGTCNVTVKGTGTIKHKETGGAPLIYAGAANAVINLQGGTFDSKNVQCVYAYAGTINISGGTYRTRAEDKKFMLNCYDANFTAGTANIIVTGGKFYDFDPTFSAGEPDHPHNFCPEGYGITKVEDVEEDGVTYKVYTVGKGGVVTQPEQSEESTQEPTEP